MQGRAPCLWPKAASRRSRLPYTEGVWGQEAACQAGSTPTNRRTMPHNS